MHIFAVGIIVIIPEILVENSKNSKDSQIKNLLIIVLIDFTEYIQREPSPASLSGFINFIPDKINYSYNNEPPLFLS